MVTFACWSTVCLHRIPGYTWNVGQWDRQTHPWMVMVLFHLARIFSRKRITTSIPPLLSTGLPLLIFNQLTYPSSSPIIRHALCWGKKRCLAHAGAKNPQNMRVKTRVAGVRLTGFLLCFYSGGTAATTSTTEE